MEIVRDNYNDLWRRGSTSHMWEKIEHPDTRKLLPVLDLLTPSFQISFWKDYVLTDEEYYSIIGREVFHD